MSNRHVMMTALVCAKCKNRLSVEYGNKAESEYDDPPSFTAVKQIVEVIPCHQCERELINLQSVMATLAKYAKKEATDDSE